MSIGPELPAFLCPGPVEALVQEGFIKHVGSALRIERFVKLPLAVVVTKEGAEGLVEGGGHYFLLSGVMRYRMQYEARPMKQMMVNIGVR